jgi:hypothetical protein
MVGVFSVFTLLPYVDLKEMGIGLASARSVRTARRKVR